jgi:lyso-ornithine lipid O-acyltransferase
MMRTSMDQAELQQNYCRQFLQSLEIEVEVKGDFPIDGLLVGNHLSYLDILVIGAEAPVCFVAKSELRFWPFIGPLLEKAGTILVDRENARKAGKASGVVTEKLTEGIPVVLFPEGTSSDGCRVLPFRPMLLQPALDAGAPITPFAISYSASGGDVSTKVCYWGDASFLPHLIGLAKLERVRATLRICPTKPLSPNRKVAAKELHAMTSAALTSMIESEY